jgi:hypothetical protein
VPDTTIVGVTMELANHYRFSESGGDSLRLDGETLRVRGYMERPFGAHWSVGLDVPYIRQSGGVLDDLVDAWHSALHLPDGARNYRPEGVLEFELADANGTFYALEHSGSGLGDIRVSIAKRLGAADGWVVRGTLKLPTGREDLLAGSGATDVTLSALRFQGGDLGGRAGGYYYGAALADVAQAENVRFRVAHRTLAVVLGGGLAISRRVGVKGQLDVNSAPYHSGLEEIGQVAVQATLGGWLAFGESANFEFAVGEDLNVSTSPDVVLFFKLSWRL